MTANNALYSLEAEQAVLGCVLINQEAYLEVASFLFPEDFFIHKHRWLWDAVTRLHRDQKPVDLLTVSDELQRRNQLEEAGGFAFLTHLINVVPTSLHVEAYGRIVQKDGIRRRLLEAASAVAKLAYEEERPITEIQSDAQAALTAAIGTSGQERTRSAEEVASAFYDELDAKVTNPEAFLATPSKLIDLNKILGGGYHRGELLIVAGRTGTGKTARMLDDARFLAEVCRKRVAYFSLEMMGEQLMMRMVAGETGIDILRLRNGELADVEMGLVADAISKLSLPNMIIDDSPGLTPEQLQAKCHRIYNQDGLDIVFVDYLQLMSGGRRFENRTQEVSTISRGLKLLAGDLRIPVVAGCQLNREVEKRGDKKPVLADLRESGTIEQDADVVLFLYQNGGEERKDTEGFLEQKMVEILVAKQRNGPTGTVPVMFFPKTNKFENAAPPEV